MNHGSLFSGIGGFDLAARWMGWNNIFHCEIAEFPRKILKYHFPESISYEDIKKTDFTKHRGTIDIISGGFPCQPYSLAGKRKGNEDDRHLWPEMCRVVREVKPRFIVGENVAGLLSWNGGLVFHEIISDLENEGYEVQTVLIPACSVNAPHRRDRLWFVAFNTKSKRNTEVGKICSREDNESIGVCNSNIKGSFTNSNHEGTGAGFKQIQGEDGEISQWNNDAEFGNTSDGDATDTQSEGTRQQSSEDRGWENRRFNNNGKDGNASDTHGKRYEERIFTIESIKQTRFNSKKDSTNYGNWENFPTQSPICGGDDGIPDRLDGITFSKWRNESIKGYGNAVVPQVVYQIFKAIVKTML